MDYSRIMLNLSIIINILLFFLLMLHVIKNKIASPQNKISEQLAKIDAIHQDVKNLNSIFTLPYLRGEAGETLLKELLKNSLPLGSFSFQHTFKSGVAVDAIVKTGKYIIPIDSKFPLQSVQTALLSEDKISKQVIRTFLKHGEDISKKYILPNEGTLNFAIMYIPSEKLYYKTFISDGGELTNKLLNLGILPASPSTLFSFIQTVVYGLKGFTFNQRQNDIMEQIETLKIHYSKLKRQFQLSNNHLKNLKQSMALCDKILEDGEEVIPN
ncbi:MAG: hypothetical protein B6229_07565 [Spirochaetaceae bacterium 4572_7]|nr:MAG: hypothetical protein B6229_07565 [Spirochaetaceae bacterium 4572_7]